MRKGFLLFFLFLMLFTFTGGMISMAGATPHGKTTEEKKGILLVAFGTSVEGAEKSILAVRDAVTKAFPDVEVRLAYTSNIIRRKLLTGRNLRIETPMQALAAMQDDGFRRVVVQTLHVIPGEEYNDLAQIVNAFALISGKYAIPHLALSAPLLGNAEDMADLAGVLVRRHADAAEKGAVVLMGHGSPHFSDSAYSALQLALDRVSGRFIVGTVEGLPSLEDVQKRLAHIDAKKILLAPLMLVAGDHALNDMASLEDPESWRNVLSKAGYQVSSAVEGLGDNSEVVEIILRHLREAAKEVF